MGPRGGKGGVDTSIQHDHSCLRCRGRGGARVNADSGNAAQVGVIQARVKCVGDSLCLCPFRDCSLLCGKIMDRGDVVVSSVVEWWLSSIAVGRLVVICCSCGLLQVSGV